MNIYDAIMKAADHIEFHPEHFEFGEVGIPKTCNSPGCALGWIHSFANVKGVQSSIGEMIEAKHLFGINDWDFYERMDELEGRARWTGRWREQAAVCARVLRLYAEEYHGHEKPKPVTPPNWQAIASKWTVGDDVRSQELVS